MARGDARLAPGAHVEVDLERILLARPRRARRQERLVARAEQRILLVRMLLREALDRGQRRLLVEQALQQRQTTLLFLDTAALSRQWRLDDMQARHLLLRGVDVCAVVLGTK